MPKELIESKSDILRNLAEQDGRDIAALMERHCRAFPIWVSKLLMRTTLANLGETESNEDGDDLARLENRNGSHRLCDGDVLDTDKLGFQFRLAIFEKQGNDFLEIAVEFVERFTLRVSAGETWDKPYKKPCLGATFNYR